MTQTLTRDYGSKSDNSKPQEKDGGVAGSVAAVIDAVTDKAKELGAKTSQLVDNTKDKAQDWAHTATDKVKDAASATADMAVQVKDKAQETASAVVHGAGEAIHSGGEQLHRTIRQYPLQSLICAMALGYLLARATSRS